MICSVPEWTGAREWNKFAAQKSAGIRLVQGRRYFVEALQKEGGGGDNLAVGWARPTQPTDVPSEVVPGSVLTPWIGNRSPVIRVGPDQLVAEAPASLELSASVFDDGLPLPASTSAPNPDDPRRLRWGWTVSALPAASSGVVWSGPPTNGAAFTFPGSADPPQTLFESKPEVTLDVPGLYRFTFTATDGERTNSRSLTVLVGAVGDPGEMGYSYISPLPGAEHLPTGTRYILLRFANVDPREISNLSSFIQVTGSRSGIHSGRTFTATDGRTVIHEMNTGFTDELVTVLLTPELAGAPSPRLQAYQYAFAVVGHMPDNPTITVRGEVLPTGSRARAFDGNPLSRWIDHLVPSGSGNSTWIQYQFPRDQTLTAAAYAITPGENLANQPSEWRLHGVDSTGRPTLLDSRSGESFEGPRARRVFSISGPASFRGYRLEILRLRDPAAATGAEIAELELIRARGPVVVEYWDGIQGPNVSDLRDSPHYLDPPDQTDDLELLETASGRAEHYGARIRGFITAPLTGAYRFWIATDDGGELWLSTDEEPEKKALIATVPGWTSAREWGKYPEQRSAQVDLVAGRRYYLEALMKEHEGGDNLAIGWSRPGQSIAAPSEVVPGSVFSPMPLEQQQSLRSPGPARRPVVQPNTKPVEPKARDPLPLPLAAKASIRRNGVSVPADFPSIEVRVIDRPAPGHLFFENRGQGDNWYTMILDNDGSPLWYRRGGGREFKIQDNGTISWANFTVVDRNFNNPRGYGAVNGYATDDHELRIFADNSYMIIGYDDQRVDVSRHFAGGQSSANVHATALQRFTAAGELVLEFRAWDHFDVGDLSRSVADPRSGNFNHSHMNALDLDEDGHVLVSSRHMSEVTKIDRDTGRILWRLGGRKNQFRFINDPLNGFTTQHFIRALGNNHYLIFDNGNDHSPAVSRAVEYVLDTRAMTATMVWQFRDSPDKYTWYMGSAQRLTNGNTLINFVQAGYPRLIEVDQLGRKRLEIDVKPGSDLYRAYKGTWTGVVDAPYLIVEPQADNVSLVFNRFGDTNVAYYRIYGQTNGGAMRLLANSPTTLARLDNLVNGLTYTFRVSAVGPGGVESALSNPESILVNIRRPGENSLANGGFEAGQSAWNLSLANGANAQWTVENSAARLTATGSGTSANSIQLTQAGQPLTQGRRYVLKFDAWSDRPRVIQAVVEQSVSPFANYSRNSATSLTPVRTTFRYLFTMQNSSDPGAQVSFKLGGSTVGLRIDSVELFALRRGDVNGDNSVDLLDMKALSNDWLRQGSALGGDQDSDGDVDLLDLGILGDNRTSRPQ